MIFLGFKGTKLELYGNNSQKMTSSHTIFNKQEHVKKTHLKLKYVWIIFY